MKRGGGGGGGGAESGGQGSVRRHFMTSKLRHPLAPRSHLLHPIALSVLHKRAAATPRCLLLLQ